MQNTVTCARKYDIKGQAHLAEINSWRNFLLTKFTWLKQSTNSKLLENFSRNLTLIMGRQRRKILKRQMKKVNAS